MEKDSDYKQLFEATSLPRFIVEKVDGEAYLITETNEVARKLFSKDDSQKVEGKALTDFIGKDNINAFETSFKKAFNEGLAVSFACPEDMGFENVGRFLINPVLGCSKHDNKNECVKFVYEVSCVPHDDTSMALQRERDDALSLLTSVFDVSEIGIVVTDRHHRIVRINDSFVRIYGWNRDDLIGNEFYKLAIEEEREHIKKSQADFLDSGIRSTGEMRLLRKDGKTANTLYTTATLSLSQGRSFQVTTVMDITLRKQMEISLRKAKENADTANQAKSTFLANMSHELRTPLNAIIGFSEIMMKETFGPLGTERYNEYMEDVYNSACHLLEIINEVLDMSKIEAGKVDLDEIYFDLEELVESIDRMMASRAFSKGISLDLNVEKNLPPFYADRRLIRQIIINLVSNSFKYSDKGGTINLKVQRNNNSKLCIIIEDSGIGIPEDRIKQALEPFGQVNVSPESRNWQGTGLGLPLTKAMAELHGGELLLESKTGQEHGTTVTVTFPSVRLKPGLDNQDASPLAALSKA